MISAWCRTVPGRAPCPCRPVRTGHPALEHRTLHEAPGTRHERLRMPSINRAVKALPADGLRFEASPRTLTVPPATDDGFSVTLVVRSDRDTRCRARGGPSASGEPRTRTIASCFCSRRRAG